MNIKQKYCSLGLPIEITNDDKSISAVIELNKNNELVCTYYKANGKEYPKGVSVYFHDVSDNTLENCYPKTLWKKVKFRLIK